MHTLKGGTGDDSNLASMKGAADEHRGAAPFHGTGVGLNVGTADDFSFALNAEGDMLSGQTPHVTLIIGHLGHHHDEVAAVGHQLATHLIGNEPYEINLMLTNSFNTKYPCQIIMTPIRIICQNMYRKVVNDRIFLAKHTATANERLQAIANGNAIEKKILAFSNVIESYQGKHMSASQLSTLVAMLFPYPKEGPREVTYRLKADEQRQRFMDQYFDAPDNRVHQDTAFGFLNAYFDYMSHRHNTREMAGSWADRRLSGLVSGNDIDMHAIREALR